MRRLKRTVERVNNDSLIKLNNGYSIPRIGLGTFRSPQSEQTINAVSGSLKCGYKLIDTASAYLNEEEVGLGLKESGLPRSSFFITTKLPNSVRGYIETKEEINSQLKRLKVDYIDLYLIHWPRPFKFHNNYREMNLESYKAMEEFYKEGKIKALGVSNFTVKHLEELINDADIIPSVNQILLYPGQTHSDIKEYCSNKDIVLEAYTPLGKPSLLNHPFIISLSAKYHKTPAQILLHYQIQRGIVPLVKSVHLDRIISNLDCFNFDISIDDLKTLDSLPLEGQLQTDEFIDNITF